MDKLILAFSHQCDSMGLEYDDESIRSTELDFTSASLRRRVAVVEQMNRMWSANFAVSDKLPRFGWSRGLSHLPLDKVLPNRSGTSHLREGEVKRARLLAEYVGEQRGRHCDRFRSRGNRNSGQGPSATSTDQRNDLDEETNDCDKEQQSDIRPSGGRAPQLLITDMEGFDSPTFSISLKPPALRLAAGVRTSERSLSISGLDDRSIGVRMERVLKSVVVGNGAALERFGSLTTTDRRKSHGGTS